MGFLRADGAPGSIEGAVVVVPLGAPSCQQALLGRNRRSSGSSSAGSSGCGGGGTGGKQRLARRTLCQRAHTRSGLVLAAVLCWLLLRYVVDVRVSVHWRTSSATPLQHARRAATANKAAASAERAPRGSSSPLLFLLRVQPRGAAAAPGGSAWRDVGRHHCSNTCFKARDGVCDEGRAPAAGAVVRGLGGTPQPRSQAEQWRAWEARRVARPELVLHIACDLGTDCDDCGPWQGHQAHPDWDEDLLPIAYLRAAHNISTRSRPVHPRSAAPLAGLRFAYVDPALDVDVSRHMETAGVVEVGISQVFYTVLSGQCGAATTSSSSSTSSGSRDSVVADVGANFGWFSLLSAHLGCRVVAWEPVPQFRALLAYNLAANRLAERVEVRPTVVASPPGSTQVVLVPNRGIWGTAGINGDNLDSEMGNEGAYGRVEVVADSLDEVLAGRHVLLLKVDVEGHEPSVLATAQGLLAGGAVDNVVLEYTPGVLERAARWSEMWRPPAMLLNLTSAGFHLSWLPDAFVRVWSEGRAVDAALPRLRQVTAANLAYDLWDAEVHASGDLDPAAAAPFCAAMRRLGLATPGVPERLHPKSLHAMFGHNTNVWATRNAKLLADRRIVGPPVGIIPLDSPTNTTWFPPEGQDAGLGAVSCSALAAEYAARLAAPPPGGPTPAEVDALMAVLIGRRCRCTHGLPCQAHAAAAEQCTRAGQTPYQDLP